MNFKGSTTTLRRILKRLRFRWKKLDDNRALLIEQNHVREKRISFLRAIKRYREQQRPIVYLDESYILSDHVSQKGWSDGSAEGLKKK